MALVQLSARRHQKAGGGTIPKANALYVHFSKEAYDCDDCVFWLEGDRCLIHGANFEAKGEDSCGFMIQGKPDTYKGMAHLNMKPVETGFARNVHEAGCRRCRHYGNRDCNLVDKDSPGDDRGIIHPGACCALQEGKR